MIPIWLLSLPLNLIKEASDERHIPWDLLASICSVESNGNPHAMRYEPIYKWTYNINQYANSLGITVQTEEQMQKHSLGLCQIMGGLARSELGFKGHLVELLDPKVNLSLGALHLSRLLKKYSEVEAIAAYNAGSPRLSAGGHFVNQPYVNKVSSRLNDLRGLIP